MVKRRKARKKKAAPTPGAGIGGGIKLSVSPVRGPHMYFKKKPSKFNVCVGETMRKKKYSNRAAVKKAFKAAVAKCKRRK